MVPRHPPCALISLIFLSVNCSFFAVLLFVSQCFPYAVVKVREGFLFQAPSKLHRPFKTQDAPLTGFPAGVDQRYGEASLAMLSLERR